MEGSEGFAGTGGHHQQDAVLAPSYGFHSAVDGDCLVIAGCSATAIIVVGLLDGLSGWLGNAFVVTVELPEGFGGGELIQSEGGFGLAKESSAVVEQEAVTVAAENEGGIQGVAVGQSLLHAITKAMVVVLGLDDSNGHVLFVAEHVVRPAALATSVEPATHDDAASGERDFLSHLAVHVPARFLQGRINVLGTDVPLCELFLVHVLAAVTSCLQLLEAELFCDVRVAYIDRLLKAHVPA